MSNDKFSVTEILHVQMVFLFSIIGIVFSAFFGALYFSYGLYNLSAILIASICITIIGLYFLKKKYVAEEVSHVILISLLVILVVANFQMGGFDNPNDSWFMVLVVLGGLLLKRGSIWLYSIIALAIIILFYVLKISGFEIPKLLPPEQIDLINLANRVFSIFTVTFLILLFRFERSMREQDLNENERALYQLANFDRLTGLFNRAYFAERFEAIVESGVENDQALLFIDLDSFKVVNDNFGHNIGDELLNAVSERLKNQLDKSDLICRHGGDEFLVMPLSVHSKVDIENLCLNLVGALKAPFNIGQNELRIGCSIGVSYYPEHGENYLELLRAADIAMYRAKAQGSEQYQIYNASLAQEISNKNQMAIDLRKGIEQEEIYLVYQPKVCLVTKDIIGYEALMRWRNKDNQQIEPAVFIAIAEEFSLVNKLGEWLFYTVAKQISDWRKDGMPVKKIAINISAKQLLRSNFVTEIIRVTNNFHIEANLIELELTESVFIASSSDTLEKLNKLSDLGYSLVIDDYGTGYASLGYLKRFPVSGLKIDKSFIDEVLDSEQDRTIVRSTIALAHELGLEVIAEGVETDAQLQLLKELGCDIIQGYYFSKPLSVDDIFELEIK